MYFVAYTGTEYDASAAEACAVALLVVIAAAGLFVYLCKDGKV